MCSSFFLQLSCVVLMGHDAVGHCFIKEIRKINNIVTPRNVPCFSLSIYANWCGFSLTAAPRDWHNW